MIAPPIQYKLQIYSFPETEMVRWSGTFGVIGVVWSVDHAKRTISNSVLSVPGTTVLQYHVVGLRTQYCELRG